MAASAPARTAPARRAPAKPERRRRTVATPPGGFARLPAGAVGRTAGAVGGLADSGMVVGLSRTRMWIGLLGLLLGGIVALNVWGLGLSASTNGINKQIDALERNNGVLRARVATNESVERVQKAASAAGLGVPEAKAIRYRKLGDGDVGKAAERLATGATGVAAVAPEAAAGGTEVLAPETAVPAPEPAAPAPVEEVDPPLEAAAPPVDAAPAAPPPAPTPAAPAAGGLAP